MCCWQLKFLQAPLDYTDTSLNTAQIALIRLRVESIGCNEDQHDPVFFNPGGPGGDPYVCPEPLANSADPYVM
jgi:hypothetical protein